MKLVLTLKYARIAKKVKVIFLNISKRKEKHFFNSLNFLDSPCYINPCLNGGTCSVNPNNDTVALCNCTSLYSGKRCEISMGCQSLTCSNGKVCIDKTNLGGSFACECKLLKVVVNIVNSVILLFNK